VTGGRGGGSSGIFFKRGGVQPLTRANFTGKSSLKGHEMPAKNQHSPVTAHSFPVPVGMKKLAAPADLIWGVPFFIVMLRQSLPQWGLWGKKLIAACVLMGPYCYLCASLPHFEIKWNIRTSDEAYCSVQSPPP
jgi:hypothetical protein